jgi:hypothetical protein
MQLAREVSQSALEPPPPPQKAVYGIDLPTEIAVVWWRHDITKRKENCGVYTKCTNRLESIRMLLSL